MKFIEKVSWIKISVSLRSLVVLCFLTCFSMESKAKMEHRLTIEGGMRATGLPFKAFEYTSNSSWGSGEFDVGDGVGVALATLGLRYEFFWFFSNNLFLGPSMDLSIMDSRLDYTNAVSKKVYDSTLFLGVSFIQCNMGATLGYQISDFIAPYVNFGLGSHFFLGVVKYYGLYGIFGVIFKFTKHIKFQPYIEIGKFQGFEEEIYNRYGTRDTSKFDLNYVNIMLALTFAFDQR